MLVFVLSILDTQFYAPDNTSGSMIPRLVPEILALDAFCDAGVVVVVGMGDSRSWIWMFWF